MIKFFEVIKVSAAHIYHSALELSPVSSTIKELYHHRQIARFPRVAIGAPIAWDPHIAISGKNRYIGLCAWSPCGRFVAAQTDKAVEIRNQLTLELITILQPPETIPDLTGPLAYSPDGRSIACTSNTTIIIWDIQTGGVAKEIGCSANNTSLVWSSDGQTICTISPGNRRNFVVHAYNVSSGTISSPGTLFSGHSPHLWTVDKSFRVVVTVGSECHIDTIDIFEVGSTLTKIQSFPLLLSNVKAVSFSPTTHHISISDENTLSIFDIRNSECLLCIMDNLPSHYFSPDGSHLVASQNETVWVWNHDSGHYILCGESQCQVFSDPPLQFSPTSSSILGHSGNILQVWHLHGFPTVIKTPHQQEYVGISRSGTRIATARKMEITVTITNILAQPRSQSIDTDMEIEGLVLTGNVLLVASAKQLVAWLLTDEGLVDGVIGDREVGRGDSIWTRRFQHDCMFRVEGQVGVIKIDGNVLHVYCTYTGEVLHPTQAHQDFCGYWDRLDDLHLGRSYLRFRNLSQYNIPFEDRRKTSRATLQEGWIKDAEGKHRLWIPVEWRTDWDPEDWLHDVMIQFSRLGGRPVLIKF